MDFAEDLEIQMRTELDEELEANRAAFNLGRRVERCYQRSNRLMRFLFCAFSGYLVGLLTAAVMHAIWRH